MGIDLPYVTKGLRGFTGSGCLDHLPSAEYGPPPPAVVLCRELKVGQCDGDAGCDTEYDAIDDKQDAKQCVLLPAP